MRTLEPAEALASAARWVDLDGEGIAGVVHEHTASWLYRPNLGNGLLGSVQALRAQPQALVVGSGQFVDLSGDGQLDLVAFGGNRAGFYERTLEGWQP